MSEEREALLAEVVGRIERLTEHRRRRCPNLPLLREVSLTQIFVLMALEEEGGRMSVSALAQALQVSAPSASAIVDRLEEHGLVTRVRDLADRRVVHVDITARGRDTVEQMVGVHRLETQSVLEYMTVHELQAVNRGLEALGAALARRGQQADPPAVAAS